MDDRDESSNLGSRSTGGGGMTRSSIIPPMRGRHLGKEMFDAFQGNVSQVATNAPQRGGKDPN